ncbi:uncharacterized protein L201_000432 [Kwoniella dendrophila CBS 6074]|uniref:Xylose isomerase-like TIM barrel domain-containing protein n=1 Tax=Kwoniella dendrophila CBS 6074 TaxID=1295534 RepID=A0AAX4JL12_9TREE
MHTNDKSNLSSADETDNENSTSFSWFDIFDTAEPIDVSLHNPFLLDTPISLQSHIHHCTTRYHSDSYGRQDNTTKVVNGSTVTPVSSNIVPKIALESPCDIKSPNIRHSPLFGLGLLTPGRKRRNSVIHDYPSPPLTSPLRSNDIKVEIESPLGKLGLGTPGGTLRGKYARNTSWISPATPPPTDLKRFTTPSLNSPFNRLGLGSPGKATSTPSPRPLVLDRKFQSTLDNTSKPHLHTPPPGWIPDTPTPYRFYTPSNQSYRPPYDLSIPRQPLFTDIKNSPKTPSSKDIKPVKPLTPLKPFRSELQEPQTYLPARLTINFAVHLSADGGLLRSLQRLRKQMTNQDVDVKGLNMFINPPKRSVKPKSDTEIGKVAIILRSFGDEFRSNSMAHAVHTTNLLSSDHYLRLRSKESVIIELKLAHSLGIPTLVIHLGSEGRMVKEDSKIDRKRMNLLILDLQDILDRSEEVVLAIENTVHPSINSLTTLRSLALLLTLFPHPRLKLCLDLAHLHVSELDLNNHKDRKDLFGLLKRIGKDRIAAIHVGGSWSQHGGKTDRHAGGSIDLSSIRSILIHPLFHSIPTLLETPMYHRYFRQSRSRICINSTSDDRRSKYENKKRHKLTYGLTRMNELEAERSGLERNLINDMINMCDQEWETNQFKLFNQYKRNRKKTENKIYKLMFKKKGQKQWENFRLSRKKELSFSRKLQSNKLKNMP